MCIVRIISVLKDMKLMPTFPFHISKRTFHLLQRSFYFLFQTASLISEHNTCNFLSQSKLEYTQNFFTFANKTLTEAISLPVQWLFPCYSNRNDQYGSAVKSTCFFDWIYNFCTQHSRSTNNHLSSIFS